VQVQAGRGALFGDAKVKRLDERLAHAESMLAGRDGAAEPAMIQDCLDEARRLIREIGKPWRPEPPRAVFDRKATEAGDLLDKAIKKRPHLADEGFVQQIGAIRDEADAAYRTQNTASWKQAFAQMANLCDRLASLQPDDGRRREVTSPAELVVALGRDLVALETAAREENRLQEFQADFKALAADLRRIDVNAASAQTQIRDWYFTKFEDLRRRLNADVPTSDGKVRMLEAGAGGQHV
jgi:hypothetical protein